jgi:hypothetical protein
MTMVDARFFNYRRNPKSNAGLGCKWYRFCGLPAGPGRKKIKKIVTARSPREAKKDILWKFTRQKRCLNRGLNLSRQK